LTEKLIQKVSSNGRIVIPKEWRDKLSIDDTSSVEMELNDDKIIIIRRKIHPLEIEDNLFNGVSPFTKEELEKAKRSVFPTSK